MRTQPLRSLAAALFGATLVAGAAGCDPFNPDLGDQPFRCGDAEPAAPRATSASSTRPPTRSASRTAAAPTPSTATTTRRSSPTTRP
ncbi:MAG: hypothetical protein R2939_08905 [Kofleriaceae bacterium]